MKRPPTISYSGTSRRYLSVLEGDQDFPTDAADHSTPTTPFTSIEKVSSFAGKVVPLGSPDFTVRRVLPTRQQRSVGPFIFLDHFGPVALQEHAMNVGPHPHIGLMTITYLYEGAILHRDSTGAEKLVVPGQVNGMISGKGVTHSERGKLQDIQPFLKKLNQPTPTTSHGLQIWMALSKQGEDVEPSFHHGSAFPLDNKYATLVVGKANGKQQSSIPIDPNLGKVLYVDCYFPQPHNQFTLQLSDGDNGKAEVSDNDYLELGVYVSTGSIQFDEGWGDEVNGETIESGKMMVIKIPECVTTDGTTSFAGTISALQADTRVAILGGTPLPEKRYMLWNFVSTSQTKLKAAAEAWEQLDRSIFGKVVNETNNDSIPLPAGPGGGGGGGGKTNTK